MPVTETENDVATAAEAKFITDMVAKTEPKAAEPKQPTEALQAAVSVPAPAVEQEETEPALDPTSRVGDPPKGAESETAQEPVDKPGEGEEVEGSEEVIEVTDEAFAAAMAAERAPISLDDVPREARALVQKKLKDLEGGFTRSMQRLAEQRKEADGVLAEQRFQKERPDDYILTMLMADPTLMDKVNAKLDVFEKSPEAREAHSAVVELARSKAAKSLDDERTAQEAKVKRSQDLITMGKAAAKAAGVPFEMGVEADIAAHLAIHGDISESQVRDIAVAKARIWRGAINQQARDKSGQYVAGKVQDRKKAGLTVRPASGASPAPAPAKQPTNDAEFTAQMVRKLGG